MLSGALGGNTVAAKVERQVIVRCPGPTPQRCRRLIATVTQGADRGRRVTLDLGPVAVTQDLGSGTRIRVQRADGSDGYGYVDVDRRTPLLLLGALFAVVAVLVARRKGALALVGLAVSVALVTTFLVPAILDGRSPVLASLVAALAVMFISLVLTYGITAQSLAASTGIAASLAAATALGDLVLRAAHLDGRGGELAPYLQQAGVGGLSLQGIMLATIVIGALGVLTDTAVTQASAVMALRHTAPELGVHQLYIRAQGVGRDHLAATTHTLVMVYVATLLPLMLLLQAADTNFTDALNGQFLAEPLVATLIGAIALMLSVPLTTLLTSLLAVHVPSESLAHAHAHAHAH
ncbi:MAG: YibE/F family protein [Chloroflexota bacterium]